MPILFFEKFEAREGHPLTGWNLNPFENIWINRKRYCAYGVSLPVTLPPAPCHVNVPLALLPHSLGQRSGASHERPVNARFRALPCWSPLFKPATSFVSIFSCNRSSITATSIFPLPLVAPSKEVISLAPNLSVQVVGPAPNRSAATSPSPLPLKAPPLSASVVSFAPPPNLQNGATAPPDTRGSRRSPRSSELSRSAGSMGKKPAQAPIQA
jgi:hypothetical protein